MISRYELFVFWGVHIDEYDANKWKDRVAFGGIKINTITCVNSNYTAIIVHYKFVNYIIIIITITIISKKNYVPVYSLYDCTKTSKFCIYV